LAAALGLATLVSAPVAAQTLGAEQKAEIESVIRDYLLANPEILEEAFTALQQKRQLAEQQNRNRALTDERDTLENSARQAVTGNPDGDVTLVEFFDYQCQYCRRVVPSLRALLAEDQDLKVVFKEFPILGEASVTAARAALAAREQDRYLPFHFALMSARDLSLGSIMALAESVGLDTERLAGDMQSPAIETHLQANLALARELGIEGTPAFVIGDELIPGAVDKTRLAQLIEEARTNCVTC